MVIQEKEVKVNASPYRFNILRLLPHVVIPKKLWDYLQVLEPLNKLLILQDYLSPLEEYENDNEEIEYTRYGLVSGTNIMVQVLVKKGNKKGTAIKVRYFEVKNNKLEKIGSEKVVLVPELEPAKVAELFNKRKMIVTWFREYDRYIIVRLHV